MAQLKMYRLKGTPVNEVPLPDGYSISNYKTESDKLAWCECCKNGLIGDDEGVQAFENAIGSNEGIDMFKDVFFLDYNGEHIGTVTAYKIPGQNVGDMHMVGIRSDFRGKGLAKYLTFITAKKMDAEGMDYTLLTTDEWRKGAVKSYLTGGFLPVEYDTGMTERWEKVLEDYGIDSVEMLNEDATHCKTVYRSSLAGQKEPEEEEKKPSGKIIVAGAGHGGIVAAMYLAKAGYDVSVYEKKTREQLGYDQSDSIHLDGFELSGVPVPEEYKVKRTPIAFVVPGTDLEPVVQADSGDTYNVEIDRKALYDHLIGLAEEAGVKFNYACDILGPVILGSRVAGIRTTYGTKLGDLVIDAAGIRSTVRTNLPDYMHITKMPADCEILRTYRAYYDKVPGQPDPELRYRVSLFPGDKAGLSWIVTGKDSVDVFIGGFHDLTDGEIEERISLYKKENPFMGDNLVRKPEKAEIPLRQPLGVLIADGYAAIGDSAFMTIPIKGSGIGYSMRAGKMLADTVIADTDGLFNCETLWGYQTKYFEEIGSGSCILSLITAILPSFTLEDIEFCLGQKLVTSEDMELFGNENGILTIIKSIKFGALRDKAKKVVGNGNIRKVLITIGKNATRFKITEAFLRSKYSSEDLAKWAEVYDTFFESIRD